MNISYRYKVGTNSLPLYDGDGNEAYKNWLYLRKHCTKNEWMLGYLSYSKVHYLDTTKWIVQPVQRNASHLSWRYIQILESIMLACFHSPCAPKSLFDCGIRHKDS